MWLEQNLTWDGKNDLGRYVESPATCKVKVGLGLKPEFDKVLLWHPKRVEQIFGLACDKNGVYVLDYNNGAYSREGMDASRCPKTIETCRPMTTKATTCGRSSPFRARQDEAGSVRPQPAGRPAGSLRSLCL